MDGAGIGQHKYMSIVRMEHEMPSNGAAAAAAVAAAAVEFDSDVTRGGTLSWTALHWRAWCNGIMQALHVTVSVCGSREALLLNLCLHSKRTCPLHHHHVPHDCLRLTRGS